MLIKNHQPALIPLFLLIQVFSLSLLIKIVRKEEEGCLVDIMAQVVGTFSGEGAYQSGGAFSRKYGSYITDQPFAIFFPGRQT